jgi:hypothetical protein
VPAIAVAVVATLPLTPSRDSGGIGDWWKMTAATVTYGDTPGPGETVEVNLAGTNQTSTQDPQAAATLPAA